MEASLMILNTNVSLNKKYDRANNDRFLTKTLTEESHDPCY